MASGYRAAIQVRNSDLVAISPKKTQPTIDSPSPTSTQRTPPHAEVIAPPNAAAPAQPKYSSESNMRNVELKTNVVDTEQYLETTGEVLLEGVRTSRATLKQRNDLSVSHIDAFDAQFRYPSSSHFNRDKLSQQFGLHASLAALRTALALMLRYYVPPQQIGVAAAAISPTPNSNYLVRDTDISSSSGILARKESEMETGSVLSSATGTTSVGGPVSIPQEFETLPDAVKELISDLIRSPETRPEKRAELEALVRPLFGKDTNFRSTVFTLHSMMHTDVLQYIRQKLAQDEQIFEQRMQEIGVLESQKAALKERLVSYEADPTSAEGEKVIAEYAASMKNLIEKLDQFLSQSRQRVNEVSLPKGEDGNFRSTFEKTKEALSTELTRRRGTSFTVKGQCQHDQRTLHGVIEERESQAAAATAAYEQWRSQSLQGIREMEAQQDALWSKVEELVKEANQIGAKRAESVRKHLDRTEEEYQRRRFHSEFMDVAQKHLRELESMEIVQQVSLSVLDTLDNFLDQATVMVDSRDPEEGLQDSKATEQQKFTQVYKKFHLYSHERLATIESRKRVVEHSAKVVEFAAQTATDNLDPNRESLRKKAKELQAALGEMRSETEGQQFLIDKWTKYFADNIAPNVPPDPACVEDTPENVAVEQLIKQLDPVTSDIAEVVAADAAVTDGERKHVEEVRKSVEAQREELKQRREKYPTPPRKVDRRRSSSPGSLLKRQSTRRKTATSPAADKSPSTPAEASSSPSSPPPKPASDAP